MKSRYLTWILCLVAATGYGQSIIRPSIYFQDMNYYNPASIAMDSIDRQSYNVYGRYKFVENEDEIWNKPMSLFLNHIGRIRNTNSFYSLSYINDQYSFYTRNTLYGGYSLQKKWSRQSSLSIGGRLVLNFDAINWGKLRLPHNQQGKTIKVSPDLDLGIEYKLKGLTAGLSAKNLISSTEKLYGEELLKNQREIYFNLSYLFTIRKNYQLAPYILLYRERNSGIDGGLYLSVFKRVKASYLFRLYELRNIFTLEALVYKGISIGAAFDYSKLEPDHNLDIVLRYKM